MNHDSTEIPSITADAARASVSPHTVHLELAVSRPDGTLAPVMHLALPASAAAELAMLLVKAVEGCVVLRGQAANRVATSDRFGLDDATASGGAPSGPGAATAGSRRSR